MTARNDAPFSAWSKYSPPHNDELDGIIGALIFWKAALTHQKTEADREFCREQISRLERKADDQFDAELAECVAKSRGVVIP